MSKQQMPTTKRFTSFNTERPEELCERDPARKWKHGTGDAARILFVGDGEKQKARLEDPGGP
jgi:hypothetical protein